MENRLEVFKDKFGRWPEYLIAVPSRANLSGAMVDFHEGCVVTMGIGNLQMRGWLAPRDDRRIRMFTMNLAKKEQPYVEFEGTRRHSAQWPQYIQGALAEYQKLTKKRAKGFDILIDSTIPIGGGLSSSSALAVIGVTALSLTNGFVSKRGRKDEDPKKIIRLIEGQHGQANQYLDLIALTAGRAEWWYGTRGGLMDQFTLSLARKKQAFHLDTRDLTYQFFDLPAQGSVVVCDTNVQHNQRSSGFEIRRKEGDLGLAAIKKAYSNSRIKTLRDVNLTMLKRLQNRMPKASYRRCLHIIKEIEDRVPTFARALEQGDIVTAGRVMTQTYRSFRDNYESSCDALDLMYQAASHSPGFQGARITGGGFGGCILSLVKKGRVREFMREAKMQYDNDPKIKSSGVESHIWEAVSGRGLFIEGL